MDIGKKFKSQIQTVTFISYLSVLLIVYLVNQYVTSKDHRGCLKRWPSFLSFIKSSHF
jgi:hypothetical protein